MGSDGKLDKGGVEEAAAVAQVPTDATVVGETDLDDEQASASGDGDDVGVETDVLFELLLLLLLLLALLRRPAD